MRDLEETESTAFALHYLKEIFEILKHNPAFVWWYKATKNGGTNVVIELNMVNLVVQGH